MFRDAVVNIARNPMLWATYVAFFVSIVVPVIPVAIFDLLTQKFVKERSRTTFFNYVLIFPFFQALAAFYFCLPLFYYMNATVSQDIVLAKVAHSIERDAASSINWYLFPLTSAFAFGRKELLKDLLVTVLMAMPFTLLCFSLIQKRWWIHAAATCYVSMFSGKKALLSVIMFAPNLPFVSGVYLPFTSVFEAVLFMANITFAACLTSLISLLSMRTMKNKISLTEYRLRLVAGLVGGVVGFVSLVIYGALTIVMYEGG